MAITAIANNETSTRFGAPPVAPNSLIASFPTTTVETNNLTVEGTFTIGDAVTDVQILKGRVATGSASGAALSLGATYPYGEGQELRYTVTSWAGTGDQFNGIYLRSQSDLDNASGGLRGAEILAVANGSAVSDLKGVFSQAYIKGDTTETIPTVYGLHAEVSFDASRANSITLTEAPAILGKILAGKVADYTKFHGAIFRFGDMDGGTRTFGNGIKLEDDAGTSGTNVLTTGLNIGIGCTTGILIAGATTTAISITGAATNDLSLQNGEHIQNVTNGYVLTDGAFRVTGVGGAGATGALTLAFAETATAAQTATFTNAPAAGNPVKYLSVWYEATKYVIPLLASA